MINLLFSKQLSIEITVVILFFSFSPINSSFATETYKISPPIRIDLKTGGVVEIAKYYLDYDQNNSPIIIFEDSRGRESFVDPKNIKNPVELDRLIQGSNDKNSDAAKIIHKDTQEVIFENSGCRTNKGFVYGLTEEDYDKGFSMLYNGDTVAFSKLAASGIVGLTRPGVKVYLENVGIFSGKRKIRPDGATTSVWVGSEAITCK